MNIAAMNVRICIQKSRTVTDEIGNHKSNVGRLFFMLRHCK